MIEDSTCPLIDEIQASIIKGDRKTAVTKLEELRELVTRCEQERDQYFETILNMKI